MPGHPTQNPNLDLRRARCARLTIAEATMPTVDDFKHELAALIPAEIWDVLKDPPLLKTEDAGRYWSLLHQFVNCECLKPTDIMGWLWIRSLVDLNWEILRLRHFRAILSDKAQCQEFECAS